MVQRIAELRAQNQPVPSAYRREGNYAVFVFDFFIVATTILIGLGTLVWVRFRRFPPELVAYEHKLARQRYLVASLR